MNDIEFWHPGVPFIVILRSAAAEAILRHRQRGWFSREAGGLLFGNVTAKGLTVAEATPPQKKDRRSETSFTVDAPSAQAMIDERFTRGLIYLGEWHSHPFVVAKPSERDLTTMRSVYSDSTHKMAALVFAIVGKSERANGLWCGLQRGDSTVQLFRRRQRGASTTSTLEGV